MSDTTLPGVRYEGHYTAASTLPTQRLFVGGQPVDASTGETFDNLNPATGRVICDVQQAGADDVDRAVASAREAFAEWSATPAIERSRLLHRAVAILRDRNQELAELETLDTGKPIQETTLVDVVTGADTLEYFAGLAPSLHGEHYELPPAAFATVRREPLGVCAGIGAWNYPTQIALWKSAPALAAGNTVIFKPAELTPLGAGRLAEIYVEAGIPPGAFNVVQGDGRTGQLMSRHPGIDKVSITGEVSTGKAVMADAASTLKQVTMELGGKSPILVFADCDVESAVSAALAANFYSGGEVCSNGTRVFVERPIYDEFVAQLGPRAAAMTVGDPFDPATQVGALISADHLAKVMGYVDVALASGATHVVGGVRPDDPDLAGGNFMTPAIFADCTDDMSFVQEEIFGPVMAVLPFDSEDEVLARANATPYGLSGAVFTLDFARAHRVAAAIEAGIVWINDYNITPASVPFGGVKQSGIGRENGLAALEAYTQTKTVYANTGPFERIY